jgi:hypothetical protein
MAHRSRSIALPWQDLARPAVLGLMIAVPWLNPAYADLQIGADNNNVDNPFVQPEDPALSGGGRDQTLDDGDSLLGGRKADIQIGLLGIDVIDGDRGNDVQIGGPDPGGNNADRAFGGPGSDVFLWQPGDGSDFFDGGSQADAVAFGNIVLDEPEDPNDPNERPLPAIDPHTGLPAIDVTNVGGFCEVIDGYEPDDAAALEELGLDHLVKFFARGTADAFEAGDQNEDNGLRVTLHLVGVEYAVCAVREGGAIEVFDLRVSPPAVIGIDEVGSRRLRKQLRDIVL